MQATRHKQVSAWIKAVSRHFPNLTSPQATVLALWSFAAIMAQTALVRGCALYLSGLLERDCNTVRQRLKEFYLDEAHKCGRQRRALVLEPCFPYLMQWVLELWPYPEIALALDPTLCRDRVACLTVSLVFSGGSIPVVWRIVAANEKGQWADDWAPMLERLREVIPREREVIVLTDRGLTSPRLFREVVQLGFHALFRATCGSKWREEGTTTFVRLRAMLPHAGTYYLRTGTIFKKRARLQATLCAVWEPGYAEAWFLVSDLTPERLRGRFYGLRYWIEQGFRLVKSFGFDWEHSRITEPERIMRLWLVYAVALLWTQAVAGRIEAAAEQLKMLRLRYYDVFDPKGRRMSRFNLGKHALRTAVDRKWRLPLPIALCPGMVPLFSGCIPVQLFKEQQIQLLL